MQPLYIQNFQPTKNPVHFSPPTHPKIKPLIRPYQRARYLDSTNLRRSLILRSKNSKVITTPRVVSKTPLCKFKRKYVELLNAQSHLSRLNFRVFSHRPFENIYLSSQLKNLSLSLTSLNIQFQGNKMVQKSFFTRLASLKNLTQVKITFFFLMFQDSKNFARLLKSLLCLNKLKDLSLNFVVGGYSRGSAVDIIAKYLKRLTQLRALRLHFHRSMNPPDNDPKGKDILNNLPLVFSKLTSLKKVHLYFVVRKEIEAKALVELFKSLKHVKDLSDFALNVGLAQISYKECNSSEVLSECLDSLNKSSIRKLSLHPYFTSDPENWSKIPYAIGRFTALNVLNVNLFLAGAASTETAVDLSQALKRLTSLSALKLICPCFLNTNLGVREIASALDSLRNLVDLYLDFEIRDNPQFEAFQQLATSLGNLSWLQFLDLRFPCRASLSDLAVISLSENLQKLVLLKNLSLNFQNNIDITKTGIEAILNTVKKFDSLSSLALDFTKNLEIDEKMMNKIGHVFQSQTSLYSVSLSVLSCPKLEEKEDSIWGLFRSLEEARHIKEAYFRIHTNEREIERMNQKRIVVFDFPESQDSFTQEILAECLGL